MTTGEAPPASFLPALFSNITIAAAAVYTSGWVYLRAYYDLFDIDIGVLELDFNETLLRSLSVLGYIGRRVQNLSPYLALGCALVALILLGWPDLRSWLVQPLANSVVRQVVLLVMTVILSFVVLVMARQAGRENATAAWKLPRLATEVVFTKDCKPDKRLQADSEHGELFLLKSTPKMYFLFSRNSDPNKKQLMDMRIYRVPTECVSHMVSRIKKSLIEGDLR